MAAPVRALLLVLSGLSCSGPVSAEQTQSLKAVISWTGSGRVMQIGTNVAEFLDPADRAPDGVAEIGASWGSGQIFL